MSPQEAADILSLLKGLQADMAEVWDRITALELNDKCMTRIEQHLGLSLPDVVVTAQSSDMLIDPPDHADLIVALVSSKPAVTTAKLPLNPLVPGFTPSRPPAINAKHSAIENKLDMLANSISGFIGSITSSASSLNSASTAGFN
ncbi:hypothetical protein RCL_jg10921.t1 [Rhizophagus clarus]|uniref:Uncharacterized protein n=1 Tax=Rhizophagus clarus TaxID=94130 RepID=A0A8H3L5D8_9GLOM|nr:hypothetical protein RCL_jg10921.t1 [Rhizophagus clarus]